MSEMVSTLRHVCQLAAKAVEKDREYRCHLMRLRSQRGSKPSFYIWMLSGGLRAVLCPRTSGPRCLLKNIVS
jgi:hypothetical protein